ncbi:MAG: hypothetical protein M0R33_18840 [Methylomonas sp.]|jgi:hypothetical protein|uniref:hypothetical protein n=1 Tax=Methylomonas sp. TaxID=418 RepID=UPI0025F6C582|nr:hypothetical protein [Methylomonas sp.]MCK9608502.1 hypothetical protein [Methylomonas sp.]
MPEIITKDDCPKNVQICIAIGFILRDHFENFHGKTIIRGEFIENEGELGQILEHFRLTIESGGRTIFQRVIAKLVPRIFQPDFEIVEGKFTDDGEEIIIMKYSPTVHPRNADVRIGFAALSILLEKGAIIHRIFQKIISKEEGKEELFIEYSADEEHEIIKEKSVSDILKTYF